MKTFYKIFGFILWLAIPTVIFAAILNSNQVGSSPSAGNVLQTNGSISTWVATSSLGLSGGTNYFTNSGATTTLSTGTVLQAKTASTSILCLGGTCQSSFSGGSQTPWTSDINAAGYNLNNINQLINEDEHMTLSESGGISLEDGAGSDINFDTGGGAFIFTGGDIQAPSLSLGTQFKFTPARSSEIPYFNGSKIMSDSGWSSDGTNLSSSGGGGAVTTAGNLSVGNASTTNLSVATKAFLTNLTSTVLAVNDNHQIIATTTYSDASTSAYIVGSSTIPKGTPTLGNVFLGNGSVWTSVSTSSLGISGTNYWTLSGSSLFNNSGSYIGIGNNAPAKTLVIGQQGSSVTPVIDLIEPINGLTSELYTGIVSGELNLTGGNGSVVIGGNTTMTNASTTNLSVGTNTYLTGLTSTVLAVDANHKIIATTTGSSLSGGATSSLVYWTSPTTVGATSSPVVGTITATSTSAASGFPLAVFGTSTTSVNMSAIATPPSGSRVGAGSYGMKFKVTQTISVSSVCRFYNTTDNQNHAVYIWDENNTGTPVASATVASTSASDSYGYKCASVTPVTLLPSHFYREASDEPASHEVWHDQWFTEGYYSPIINDLASVYSGTAGTYPSTALGLQEYDDVSFYYTPMFSGNALLSVGTTTSSTGISGLFTTPSGVPTIEARNDGMVSIGSDPSALGQLTVTGADTLTPLVVQYANQSVTNPILFMNNLMAGGGSSIAFGFAGTNVSQIRSDSSGNTIYASKGDQYFGYEPDFGIPVNINFGNTQANPYMRILSTGNVGIGTTTPASKLDVMGTTTVETGDINIRSATGGLILKDTVTGTCARIQLTSGVLVPTTVTCPF